VFEKEAEEWATDNVCKDCSRYEKCMGKEQCTCKDCSKEKWQNGAEFGLQKGILNYMRTKRIKQMTADELAEEYIDEHSPSCKEYPKAGRGALKQAFLAGLEAGRPVWHRVADGDLPKDNMPYIVKVKLNYRGAPNISYWIKDNLHDDFEKHKNYTEDIIAWCEIPKYTEE
jgi:hypothetical protein